MNFGVIMYQTSASKGQELVAQRMTKELASYGRAVLITSRFHDFKPVVSAREVRRNGGYMSYQDDEAGITTYRVESRKVDWPPRRIEFTNFISNLDRIVGELDLDVLIAHSTLWNGPDLTALFVSWKRRLKGGGSRDILFCHMSHYQPPTVSRYPQHEREWRRTWNEYVLKRIVIEADLLLVTTPMAERHMVEFGARREQCLLFPGGIEVPADQTPDDLERFREKHGIPAGDKLVTFLGTVEERKNVGAIVDVARLLEKQQGVRFVIGGRCEGSYAKGVRSSARGASNVHILGEVAEEEKPALIRSSYLNLNLSRLEALGLTQLEFMSAGVPAVTSGVGGQSWIVRNGQSGIVLRGPDDVKGAASAIVDLSERGGYRDRLGKNAKKFAVQFTMKDLVKGLVEKLEEKAHDRGSPPGPDSVTVALNLPHGRPGEPSGAGGPVPP